VSKSAEAFRTISEVAEELDVPKHVLRFWEQKFPQIKPMKRGGGRRYYRPEDLELLRGIRHLLHREGYTIRGVQKILRTQGVDGVKRSWLDGSPSQKQLTKEAAPPAASKRSRAKASSEPAIIVPLPADVRATLKKAMAELEACRKLLAATEQAGASARARK
jgi:DNA-binding transcriptional MerR regulator